MARIPLGRRAFAISKERAKLREKIKSAVPRSERKQVRQELARKLDQVALARAFKTAGLKRKKDRDQAAERYHDAKLKAVKEFDPDISEEDAETAAETSTLLRVDAAIRRRDYKVFMRVRRKGKLQENLFQRSKLVKVGKRTRRVRYGRFYSKGQVKRSLAQYAYWERVKSLARALGLKETGRDLAIARRADRAMLEVPESARRRIYESIVRRYT
jgi:hypothetical protein